MKEVNRHRRAREMFQGSPINFSYTYIYPEQGKHQVSLINKFGQKERIDRRKAWILKLRIGKPISFMKELLEEQKLYNFLEESRLADALQALSELRYLARCSERMFRWSQKFLQNTQIEESLTSHAEGALPHRTYFSEIQVTPVFNQIVNVESKINKSTEEILISPVSPIVSDEEFDTYLSEDLLEHSSELNCDPRE
ncbi:hypothetical protein NQ318_001382 [Aromia moschata]|uniref:Uncharacterized protein n=1 Tax=Aromia moschata TaxID=1265417 RepID=A0AAV8YWL1_9CUCU|nr:hypothetical protein NQ318_001382 [Aromia moschata]